MNLEAIGALSHEGAAFGTCDSQMEGREVLDRDAVASVLEEIRHALQAHGGDLSLVDVTEDGTVKVALKGACRGCPMAQMTIKRGVEARLRQEIPEVKEVVAVEPEEEHL